MSRWLCALCAVAVAIWAGGSPIQAAALDVAKIAAIDKAADGFSAMARDAYRTGQPPRQTDPAAKALLDIVFDTSPLKTGGPVPFAEIDKLNNWVLRVVTVGSVYIFAGTGVTDFARLQAKPLDETQQRQIELNTAAFAPELGRYFDAEVQLEQALVETTMVELAAHPAGYATPQAEGGLNKMRGGLKQTLTGVIVTMLTAGLEPDWLRARLPPLIAVAPVAAKFLSPADRSELRDIAQEVAGQLTDPGVKSGLDNFAKAIGG
jgi:hypothetical protein